MKRIVLSALLPLVFATPSFGQEGVPGSADVVKNANWKEMETVTVELTEHDFEPKDIKLKADKPYRLVIKNKGEKDHYYTAAEFYQSVAWRKAQSPRPNGGELKAPYFSAVEVYKGGGAIELFFVPVKKGTYDVICTIDDHKEQGMTGTITVE
jgi:uncharacterized cupredoxin-like copper-binding protein